MRAARRSGAEAARDAALRVGTGRHTCHTRATSGAAGLGVTWLLRQAREARARDSVAADGVLQPAARRPSLLFNPGSSLAFSCLTSLSCSFPESLRIGQGGSFPGRAAPARTVRGSKPLGRHRGGRCLEAVV